MATSTIYLGDGVDLIKNTDGSLMLKSGINKIEMTPRAIRELIRKTHRELKDATLYGDPEIGARRTAPLMTVRPQRDEEMDNWTKSGKPRAPQPKRETTLEELI